MAFTGGWRARQFSVDPYEKLHTAGSDHVADSKDPNPTWIAPGDLDQVPTYLDDYPETDYFYFAETTGITFDNTDYESHETTSDSAITATDQGAAREALFEPPLLQAHDERYLSARFEGVATSPVPDVALRRGLNADPVNNPEGFRLGWVEQNWVDRKMYDPERIHDRRLNLVNTADVDQNQPGQPVPFGNPFASLARAITTVAQKPMIRREPPPISESVVTDGSEDMYDATETDWVVG